MVAGEAAGAGGSLPDPSASAEEVEAALYKLFGGLSMQVCVYRWGGWGRKQGRGLHHILPAASWPVVCCQLLAWSDCTPIPPQCLLLCLPHLLFHRRMH